MTGRGSVGRTRCELGGSPGFRSVLTGDYAEPVAFSAGWTSPPAGPITNRRSGGGAAFQALGIYSPSSQKSGDLSALSRKPPEMMNFK